MSAGRHNSGFTIIELTMVIAIGVLLLSLTLPVGVGFYRKIVALDVAEEMTLLLRTAHADAKAGTNDSMHGVYIATSTMTLFQGNTYATRIVQADKVSPLASGFGMTGMPAEILFMKQTGFPSATGTMQISQGGYTHSITVHALGLITLDE